MLGIWLLFLSTSQYTAAKTAKKAQHSNYNFKYTHLIMKERLEIMIWIGPENSTATLAHLFNSRGYRTYW
jgi:alpha-amylase/alpha-mannosidase (GH57 family)